MKKNVNDKEEYQFLLDNAPVPYLKLRLNTTIENINIAAALLLEADLNQLKNKVFRDFIAPIYLELFDLFWNKITAEEVEDLPLAFSEYLKIITLKSNILYVRLQGYIHGCCSNKSDTHYFISITDLSETKKLLEHNEFQSKILNSTIESIVVVNLSGDILLWNHGAEKLYEYKTSEVTGKNIISIFPPEKYTEFYKLIAKVKKGETIERYETQRITKNSEMRDIMLTLSPVKNEKGNTTAIVSISYDISREKQAEIALEKWGNIFRNIESGVAVLDSEQLTFEMVNPALASIYGYDSEYLIGKNYFTVSSEPAKNQIEELFKKQKEKGYQSYEGKHRKKNGTIFSVSVDISYVSDKNNETGYTVLNIQDLTEKESTDEKLKQYNQLAKKSEIIKSAFLSNISHEIRTPMNSILGFANLLHNDNLMPEKRKKFIQIINSSSQQLLNIINDIIDISKIEAGEFTPNETAYPLNLLLLEVYTYFGTNGKVNNKPNINLLMSKVLSNNESKVLIDIKRVKQVLNYLMLNAIKFTLNGFVEFGYKLKKASETKTSSKDENSNSIMIEFYVKDTGIGIAKESQNIIFERFMQVDNSLTRKYGGTGIGLTISKSYTHLLKGDIWVESEEGEGSTFYFTIPFKPVFSTAKDEADDNKKDNNPEKHDLSEKCILIVEDDLASKAYFDEILIGLGDNLKLLFADNGKEAIDVVKNVDKIDLILMDIQLPIMNGFEATKEIKKINPDIPVIAQTAHALDNDKTRSIEAGCDDYISKPFLPEDLVSLIKKHI